MLYICNAFSLQMLPREGGKLNVIPTTTESVASDVTWTPAYTWAVGHADTSAVVAGMLGIDDPGPNRVSIQLKPGDVLYVAQVVGGRLPEGTTTLPEGFTIQWMCVYLD